VHWKLQNETLPSATIFLVWGSMGNQSVRNPPLDMAHEKLVHLLNFFWLLLVFPATVAILAGVVSHSPTFGVKTFLLIEVGIAILSPLLTAILDFRDPSRRNRGK
jgi:hypothetical protein